MPSDQSTWLIAVPQDGDSESLLPEITNKLPQHTRLAELGIPSFKTGTLDSLIALSEELPKQDAFFTATVAKIVDTLRNLLNNDPTKLVQHVLVNELSADDYVLGGWKWNDSRYGVQRSLREMVDVLNKEMASIDNVMKAKLNNYNLVKGSLVQMQRKKTGNLSVRSLVGLVSKDDIIQDSEYLETCLVAVPKILVKEWNLKYERLTNMVVPRSSSYVPSTPLRKGLYTPKRPIASDSEYTLFGVVIFKRVHDEFIQKCRENKFIVRDFIYSEEQIAKEGEDLDVADTTEKELWTELLRLSRTYFSESFQIFLHLKILRLFVESVLRYGLPANYVGLAIRPESKYTKKTLSVLTNHLSYLRPRSSSRAQTHSTADEFAGEYQSLMEQEFFDFVLYEVPWIVL
ncbi:ATPase V1 complex subunit C [Suillus bovinus]|uniref:ATPase V1 complex subunit C n=1 Tax=Suillus bovinus TaxID=48563 RepID=UPI001B885CBF|nr:ATPase V1 complex subunit C [Suillus bovinus]KAG2160086.1 ATPase V1 complex subunit C [Suillus bovinus]